MEFIFFVEDMLVFLKIVEIWVFGFDEIWENFLGFKRLIFGLVDISGGVDVVVGFWCSE